MDYNCENMHGKEIIYFFIIIHEMKIEVVKWSMFQLMAVCF